MPHTKSAEKRSRQYEKRRLHNRDLKKSLRAELKNYQKQLDSGTLDEARKVLNLCAQKLDKAGKHRIFHPNKVARKKSQLARMLNQKQAAPTAPSETNP